MNKRLALTGALKILLISMFGAAHEVRSVETAGSVYIRADGSVYPSTAAIFSADNITYTLTGELSDLVVVEKDDIVIDGAGFTNQGKGIWGSRGISLSNRSNVTIKNTSIKDFQYAMFLESSHGNSIIGNNIINSRECNGIVLYNSSNTNIIGNNLAKNSYAMGLEYSSNNSIRGNNITASNIYGVYIWGSRDNAVSDNNISDCSYCGIGIYGSSHDNTLSGNSITNNNCGICAIDSSDNSICHNYFMNNSIQVHIENSVNTWDSGYPSGGNYWSDYSKRYPNATKIDDSGIWNIPYLIDTDNRDNYPIVPEFPSFFILHMFITATLIAIILPKKACHVVKTRSTVSR
jgi:parallel beta-helix repeat protein